MPRTDSLARLVNLASLLSQVVVLDESGIDGWEEASGVNGSLNLDGHGKSRSFRVLELPVIYPFNSCPP